MIEYRTKRPALMYECWMSDVRCPTAISIPGRVSSLWQTDVTHPSSHLHFCPLESTSVFSLNWPCFTASNLNTGYISVAFHFMWKHSGCQKCQYLPEFLPTSTNSGYWACFCPIAREGLIPWCTLWNTTPFFLPSPPLNLQTVQPPFLCNPPHLYWFFVNTLPSKSQFFHWTSKILKFFIQTHLIF